MTSSDLATIARCHEVEFLERIKSLEDQLEYVRLERDRIAHQLANSQAENMQLKGELARLREKEKLEMVKSKIILTRLEKTLEMVEEDASVAPSLKNLHVAAADKIVTMAPTNKNENVVPTSNNDNLLASEYLQYQPEATNPVEDADATCFSPEEDVKEFIKIEIDEGENEVKMVEVRFGGNEEKEPGTLFGFKDESEEKMEHRMADDNHENHELMNEHEAAPQEDLKPNECLACDFNYTDRVIYKRHLKTVHGLSFNNFKCFHCCQTFQALFSLERHMLKMHTDAPKAGGHSKDFADVERQCVLCDFSTVSSRALHQHGASTHGFSARRRPCNRCDFVARYTSDLGNHVKTIHEGQRLFQCHLCVRSFTHGHTLKRHLNNIHQKGGTEEQRRRFKCDLCDRVYKQKDHLTVHVNSVHKGLRQYCDKCPFSCVSRHALKEHAARKHGPLDPETGEPVVTQSDRQQQPVKSVPCDQCKFVASCKAVLREHIEVKHEGKRYYCDQCSHASTTKQSLKKHTDAVHANTQYACDHCDMKFSFVESLRRHQRIRRQLAQTNGSDATKKHKCDVCGMNFCFPNSVNRHKRHAHSEAKDIMPCDECDKVFYSKQNLNRHKKSAHSYFE